MLPQSSPRVVHFQFNHRDLLLWNNRLQQPFQSGASKHAVFCCYFISATASQTVWVSCPFCVFALDIWRRWNANPFAALISPLAEMRQTDTSARLTQMENECRACKSVSMSLVVWPFPETPGPHSRGLRPCSNPLPLWATAKWHFTVPLPWLPPQRWQGRATCLRWSKAGLWCVCVWGGTSTRREKQCLARAAWWHLQRNPKDSEGLIIAGGLHG